jgi:hypothetical protein
MPQVYFHFYGELNDFLLPGQWNTPIVYPLAGSAAVKHPIEALGVPHPEVDLILVNGRPVDFGYQLQPNDQVYVYPMDRTPTVYASGRVRPPLMPPVRFALDTHLGQLATYLRLFGFDALYRNDFDDYTLAQIASGENRVLLTRDRGLLKRKVIVYGYCVRENAPKIQLISVLRRYNLANHISVWQRCLRCNALLKPTPKEAILDRLEPKTKLYYNEFQQCPNCNQVYWRGSHYTRMQAFIESVMDEVQNIHPR